MTLRLETIVKNSNNAGNEPLSLQMDCKLSLYCAINATFKSQYEIE